MSRGCGWRREEEKAANQGGAKWLGPGGTSAVRRHGYNPEVIRIGQDKSRNQSAVKVWDQREYRNRRFYGIGTRNIEVALRRLRKFVREGAPKEQVMMPQLEENHGIPGRNQS